MNCISFQIINIDYQVVDFRNPIIRVYGRADDGKSVCCLITDFEPYFYVELENKNNDIDIECLKNNLYRQYIQIKKIEKLYKYKPIGFQKNKILMLKIIVYLPKNVQEIRDEISKDKNIKNIYESDILFRNRFMVDNDINGFQWVYVKKQDIITNNNLINKIIYNCDILFISNKINP